MKQVRKIVIRVTFALIQHFLIQKQYMLMLLQYIFIVVFIEYRILLGINSVVS